MEKKNEHKKRYFIYKEKKEKECSDVFFHRKLIHNNNKEEEGFSKSLIVPDEETVIVELKTQGSSLSLENNRDENSKEHVSVTSSYCSSTSSSSYDSSSENSSYDDDSAGVYVKEKTIDKTASCEKRKCFASFSESSSFYVQSGSDDFENDSLFNESNDSEKPDDIIENNRKEGEGGLDITENANKRKNMFNFLMKNCIKLFSLNAYLYNDVFRYNPHLYGFYETCRSNEKRSEQIAHLCTQFDLIFLRSVYGKYQRTFFEVLKNTHTIVLDNCPLSSVHCIAEFMYTLQNYVGGNGGLFMCWKKKDFRLTFYDYIYLTSDILVKRKVIKLIKLKYKEWYDLYFIHAEFDLFSTTSKLSNVDDLIFLIKKTLWKIYVLRIFYKNRKYLRRKKEVKNSSKEVNGIDELIEQIHQKQNEIEIMSNGSSNRSSNKSSNKYSNKRKNSYEEKENSNNKKETYIELKFKKTSMFVIGSFNIDRKEMRNIYNVLITLNNQGVLKDLFFYQNIHFKIQSCYDIVSRENTLVGGLNYCFGLTDNIFLLEQFTFSKESIEDMMYLYHPIDIIKENLQLLKKSELDYNLENILPLINRNCICVKFQNVFNCGVDILTQKKNNELSDHWALSAKFLLNNLNRKGIMYIEQNLRNFFRNVHKYFVTNKNRYHYLCEINSILRVKKKEQNEKKEKEETEAKKKREEKEEYLQRQKYDYSKRCIITSDNIHTFHKLDKRLLEVMEHCFEF